VTRQPAPLKVVPDWWWDRVTNSNRPFELEDLGELRLHLRTGSRGSTRITRVTLAGVIVVVFCLFIGVIELALPGKGGNAILFAIYIMVVGLSLCFVDVHPSHFSFAGFDHGFLWSVGTRTFLVSWDQVEGVVADIVRYHGSGSSPVAAWSKRRLVLQLRGGAELRVPFEIKATEQVVAMIEYEAYRRIRQTAEELLGRGRYVEFGQQFALGPHELICNELRWSWEHLETVEVANRHVQVFACGSLEPSVEVPVLKVPNAAVLVDVSQALIQAHRR
jgi:hypothetical protein